MRFKELPIIVVAPHRRRVPLRWALLYWATWLGVVVGVGVWAG